MTDLSIDGVSVFETPQLRHPCFLMAFAGWPDAGEVATGSLRYLVASTGAKRFARLDHEEFYQLGALRPLVVIEEGEYKRLRFPSNDFFYWKQDDTDAGVICFLGTEPHLRWRKYTDTILEVANRFEVRRTVLIGGLFDALPHTREPRVSGAANSKELMAMLRGLGVVPVDYQGPSSIHSMVSIACTKAGMDNFSLWGHAPLYVRMPANPKVCHALLTKVCAITGVEIDLEGIRSAGEYLDGALNRLLAQNDELRAYVNKLEEQFEGTTQASPLTEEGTEKIIREVEEFLRREQRRRESSGE